MPYGSTCRESCVMPLGNNAAASRACSAEPGVRSRYADRMRELLRVSAISSMGRLAVALAILAGCGRVGESEAARPLPQGKREDPDPAPCSDGETACRSV